MIRELKALPPSRQRELIRLFDPASLPDEDGMLWPTLVEVIKEKALDGRPSDDLPLVIRERLVEALTKRFGLDIDTDGEADLDLGLALIGFLEGAWRAAQQDPVAREEIDRFFSRKGPFISEAVQDVGSKLGEGLAQENERQLDDRDGTSLSALILQELGPEVRQDLGNRDSESAVERALRRLDVADKSRRLFGELSPSALGQLAGAIYMAGITSGPDGIELGESDAPARARRARHSTTVQNTAALSAFVLGATGAPDVTANRVAIYLDDLGYQYETLGDGRFRIPRGGTSVHLDVVDSAGGSQVNIWSEVGKGSDYRDQDLASLLKVNEISRFAKFSVAEPDQALLVGCELFGDTLDLDELGLSLANIVALSTAFVERSPEWVRELWNPLPDSGN